MWRRRYILIISCVIASVIVAGILILEVTEKKKAPYPSPETPATLKSRLKCGPTKPPPTPPKPPAELKSRP